MFDWIPDLLDVELFDYIKIALKMGENSAEHLTIDNKAGEFVIAHMEGKSDYFLLERENIPFTPGIFEPYHLIEKTSSLDAALHKLNEATKVNITIRGKSGL